MTQRWQKITAICAALIVFGLGIASMVTNDEFHVMAQTTTPSPTPAAAGFDQAAAIAKLKEQIRSKEQLPSTEVFKNIQTPFIKNIPAGRVLAVMEIAYARSLGVDCRHCHVVDKWDSDENPNKQIARDMAAMMARINGELLKNIKNLSQNPTVNCTTCHRGQAKPALNMPISSDRR
jgi:hypothetical protein